MSPLWDLVLFVVAWLHVLSAPFTKVEESFSLHATHDVLMYGVGPTALQNYDHKIFPGPVPRTFIGSVLLAWLSKPVLSFANYMGLLNSKYAMQITVRLVLATLNCIGLCFIRRAVSRRWGSLTGVLYILVTCSQFHLPFWMGRTLPNMFALLPVNAAIYSLIPPYPRLNKPTRQGTYRAIALLTFTAVIFRAEVTLLLIPITLQALLSRTVKMNTLIVHGVVAGLGSLALTLFIDSYFWSTFLWPELSSLHYNVILGKSSNWGVSPPLSYFTTHIPKLLLTALPLGLVGWSISSTVGTLVTPFVMFVAGMSYLKHKEWRFVVYVVPVMNVAAAVGMKWLITRRISSSFYKLTLWTTAFGLLLVNILATITFTIASRANYPGGDALVFFHEIYWWGQVDPLPHIHISNLAAQTGASLFLHLHSPPYPPYSSFSHLSPPTSDTKSSPDADAAVDTDTESESSTSALELGNKKPDPDSSGTRRSGDGWGWYYDKTENLTLADLSKRYYITHLISEVNPSSLPASTSASASNSSSSSGSKSGSEQKATSNSDTDADADTDTQSDTDAEADPDLDSTWSTVAVISSFERWEIDWEWWLFKRFLSSPRSRSKSKPAVSGRSREVKRWKRSRSRSKTTKEAEKERDTAQVTGAEVSPSSSASESEPAVGADGGVGGGQRAGRWPLRMVLKERLWILDRKVKVKG
ncbi:hypothetical protein AX16_006405 [Volvariella volvacea WC 439]|nr:hypothetical protein AX16_006405 [Volvariella volvacea WC 439]